MSRQPSWLLWSTLPAVLLVIAFGLWLRLDHIGPTPVDQSWLGFVGLDHGSVPYWVAVVLAEVGGGTGVVICTGLLTALFALLRRWRSAAFLATTMLAGIATSEILKAIVTRLRPSDQLYESLGFSYPSGHSMGAAALAMSLAIIASRAHEQRREARRAHAQCADADRAHEQQMRAPAPRLRFHWSFIAAGVWILTMMWSRTALQVHWLTDTLAGALIGIAVAVLADEFWTLLRRRTRSPRFALWLAG
ncbi:MULTISPECIES: phosphatase PAP2 family protein [unclassified Brevibacterium]|uniref:phosphatase PAP2 family protein n=1 Tax=unclassified Brevibacterium TaxID=2614124 RepID=UPI0010806B5A|nr:phosphatase PAP2 family protein [Brevibacterium sp. S111]TGD11380.1 phosphatase PAP2 family protein [Brevibacterium sp. S111]